MTVFEASTKGLALVDPTASTKHLATVLEIRASMFSIVDDVGLFQAEIYISGMHGETVTKQF